MAVTVRRAWPFSTSCDCQVSSGWPPESDLAEPADSVGGGDDRELPAEVARCDVVEVIAVIVRQDDQIDRRQVGYLAGGLNFTARPDAVAEIDVGALVHECRIGQDGKTTEIDQCRCVTDKVDFPVIQIGRRAFRNPQRSHRAPPCGCRPKLGTASVASAASYLHE
jgi:hypothetical protein